MASSETQELVSRFEEFYRSYYHDEIGELAQQYPNERRSLYIDWGDLYRFDQDLADDFRNQPDQLKRHAEEALRLYDLPANVSLGQAHVRIRSLPRTTDIRNIRAHHVNTLVSARGIIRKATGVKPKIQVAAFECQRCGTLSRIPQNSGRFQEPHECQGCERQGPYRISFDQSEFVDAQKLRIQESPEGLRGGATPQSIDVHIEDDITGKVTPGDHVVATGTLRLEQQGTNQEKSTLFDVYMEGISIEVEEEQFEDMEITEEDKQAIVELSTSDDIYEMMVDSIAPSIYGHENAKTAMVLQLFSGVTKHLPDGSRTRGDLHMLLIGDPGTGKCHKYDSKVTLADGTQREIGPLVDRNLTDPIAIGDGVYQEVEFGVLSVGHDGEIGERKATKVWKREGPTRMYRIRTASGSELEITPSHPLFVLSDSRLIPMTAEELKENQCIAVPRSLPIRGDDTLDIEVQQSDDPSAITCQFPPRITPRFARLLGYILANGEFDHRGNVSRVRITSTNERISRDITEAIAALGIRARVHHRTDDTDERIDVCSTEFVHGLIAIEPSICSRSGNQRVPDAVMRATPAIKAEFLKAYIEYEGHVSSCKRELTIGPMDDRVLDGIRSMFLTIGIQSSIEDRQKGVYHLRITGANFDRYLTWVGFVTDRPTIAVEPSDDDHSDAGSDTIPITGETLERVRTSLALPRSDCGVSRSTYCHFEHETRSPSREDLGKVIEAFEKRIAWLHGMRAVVSSCDWETIDGIATELNVAIRVRATGVVDARAAAVDVRKPTVADGGRSTDARGVVFERIDAALAVEAEVDALRALIDADVGWDRIESIEGIESDEDWVYDLEVEETHSYIANNIISHNSQLLQYIRNIAPRSVYTSGKGSSAAGLTASAIRDDFGDGQQWTLEAGALVLADRGIAAIDELDKMDTNDRSAMHEALEQQSISISKAGINATLKSRCSLLGAANPKYGRFDQYEPIGEQIDLEPALISRFDLIFTVTDQPNEEEDRNLARHILDTNYAGEVNTQRSKLNAPDVTQEELDEVTKTIMPAIDADLFRKYVAYAQQTCYPRLTETAREAIENFYVDLRARGADQDAPVPVTARKLEALVRLSEASARVRLSDTVDVEDAERVIAIVRSCLQDIGVDPETGQYDADVIETGRSKTQRDRVKGIKQIIRELQDEYVDGAPIDEVLSEAEAIGIDRGKAEHEIQKLRDQGEVYSPKKEHLRVV